MASAELRGETLWGDSLPGMVGRPVWLAGLPAEPAPESGGGGVGKSEVGVVSREGGGLAISTIRAWEVWARGYVDERGRVGDGRVRKSKDALELNTNKWVDEP